MDQNKQDQPLNSTDDIVKKMESYFLSTQEEMSKLRNEIAELTRILKTQRAGTAVSANIKSFGAPTIADMLNRKSAES